jgi:hypothetical protein
MNAVRAELDAGVPLGERAALQARISQILSRTRAICAAAGGTPEDLPGPSRNAYRFLAAIDVDALPEPSADRPRVQPMRFPGMVAETEWLRQAMADIAEAEAGLRPWVYDDEGHAEDDVPRDRAAIRRTLDECAAVIRRDLAAPDRGAESLLEPTRRATRWICWLAEEGRLDDQLATLTHVARFAGALPPTERRSRRVRLMLYDTASLVRGRHGAWTGHGEAKRVSRAKRGARAEAGGWSELTAHQGFVDAPHEVLVALVRVGLGAKGAPRSLLRDYARGEAFRRVGHELETALPRVGAADPSASAVRAGGHFHDLDAAFARVNAAYFEGAMQRPTLRWSRRASERKLGHYDFTRDEVVLSVRLDAPDVPRAVVDFVVYHELLHKRHGLRHSGTRRLAHTAAFRRDERRFVDYAAVQAWMEGMGRRVD